MATAPRQIVAGRSARSRMRFIEIMYARAGGLPSLADASGCFIASPGGGRLCYLRVPDIRRRAHSAVGSHAERGNQNFMDDKQIFLSTDLAHRLAAIDVGSNSVRLIVAEPLRGGNYRILDEEREPTRLGRALNSTGMLDPQSIELTLGALRRFKQIASGYQVDDLRTIATCAVREASNG